jgi:predicted nucleic acid-binding protein
MNSTTVSLDTNLIVSVLNQEKGLCDLAIEAIEDSRKSGRLVVSGPVYAELMAGPFREESHLDMFLADTGIGIDWTMSEAIWREAGRAYFGYVQRRKASGAEAPRRILADFLIGAHAMVRGYRLLTTDGRHYKVAFPKLVTIRI